MDRKAWQRLAKTRLQDSRALLGRKRWSAAYYLCGYAVECALKACLLRYLGESGALFGDDRSYLKSLADCWTHDLDKLVKLAGLEDGFEAARKSNAALKNNWVLTKDWDEASRYKEKTEIEARDLYRAVSDNKEGVLWWIQSHW